MGESKHRRERQWNVELQPEEGVSVQRGGFSWLRGRCGDRSQHSDVECDIAK